MWESKQKPLISFWLQEEVLATGLLPPTLINCFLFIPLPSSGDCSPVSGPTNWLMFATPVRGLELSEIWGLFVQICEILLQQWNCIFSPLDVAVFLFSRLIFEHQALYYIPPISFCITYLSILWVNSRLVCTRYLPLLLATLDYTIQGLAKFLAVDCVGLFTGLNIIPYISWW